MGSADHLGVDTIVAGAFIRLTKYPERRFVAKAAACGTVQAAKRGSEVIRPARRDAAAIVWILPIPISRARRNAVVETSSQRGIGRRSASQSAAGLYVLAGNLKLDRR